MFMVLMTAWIDECLLIGALALIVGISGRLYYLAKRRQAETRLAESIRRVEKSTRGIDMPFQELLKQISAKLRKDL